MFNLIINLVVTIGVFAASGPSRKRYKMDLTQAIDECRRLDGRLASEQALADLSSAGSFCCDCGWTTSGRRRYPIVESITGCIVDYVSACAVRSKADAWCMANTGKTQ